MTVRNWLLIVANPAIVGSNVQTVTVFGRTYSCTVGSTVTIPGDDAIAAQGQNLQLIAATGPTSARPKPGDSDVPDPHALKGLRYVDTTVGAEIICDGSGVWRSTTTGAAV